MLAGAAGAASCLGAKRTSTTQRAIARANTTCAELGTGYLLSNERGERWRARVSWRASATTCSKLVRRAGAGIGRIPESSQPGSCSSRRSNSARVVGPVRTTAIPGGTKSGRLAYAERVISPSLVYANVTSGQRNALQLSQSAGRERQPSHRVRPLEASMSRESQPLHERSRELGLANQPGTELGRNQDPLWQRGNAHRQALAQQVLGPRVSDVITFGHALVRVVRTHDEALFGQRSEQLGQLFATLFVDHGRAITLERPRVHHVVPGSSEGIGLSDVHVERHRYLRHFAATSDRDQTADMGFVGRLVLGEAHVAKDAKLLRLAQIAMAIGAVDARAHIGQ